MNKDHSCDSKQHGTFFFLDKLEKKLQTERFLLNFDEIFITLLLYFWLYE